MTALAAPAGAIDAHVHLFDPQRHPFADDTPYRPMPAECGGAADLAHVLAAHGFAAALVVAPTSGYGYDNRCLLAGLAAARGRWRGIARVPVAVGIQLVEISDTHGKKSIGKQFNGFSLGTISQKDGNIRF